MGGVPSQYLPCLSFPSCFLVNAAVQHTMAADLLCAYCVLAPVVVFGVLAGLHSCRGSSQAERCKEEMKQGEGGENDFRGRQQGRALPSAGCGEKSGPCFPGTYRIPTGAALGYLCRPSTDHPGAWEGTCSRAGGYWQASAWSGWLYLRHL